MKSFKRIIKIILIILIIIIGANIISLIVHEIAIRFMDLARFGNSNVIQTETLFKN